MNAFDTKLMKDAIAPTKRLVSIFAYIFSSDGFLLADPYHAAIRPPNRNAQRGVQGKGPPTKLDLILFFISTKTAQVVLEHLRNNNVLC